MLTKEMYDTINSYNKARVCIERACVVLYKDYQSGCDTYTTLSEDEINGLIADAFKAIVWVNNIKVLRAIILDIFDVVLLQYNIMEMDEDTAYGGIFDYINDVIRDITI